MLQGLSSCPIGEHSNHRISTALVYPWNIMWKVASFKMKPTGSPSIDISTASRTSYSVLIVIFSINGHTRWKGLPVTFWYWCIGTVKGKPLQHISAVFLVCYKLQTIGSSHCITCPLKMVMRGLAFTRGNCCNLRRGIINFFSVPNVARTWSFVAFGCFFFTWVRGNLSHKLFWQNTR